MFVYSRIDLQWLSIVRDSCKLVQVGHKHNIFRNMHDLKRYSRHWIKEFIEVYKSEECLWQPKHFEYNNQILRNKAYDRLIDKLKEVESNPDKAMAIRKINSLRSAFRRELRKKKTNNDYQPRLWYFDTLSFVADQEYPTAPKCYSKGPEAKVEICYEEEFKEDHTLDVPEACEEEVSPTTMIVEESTSENQKVLERVRHSETVPETTIVQSFARTETPGQNTHIRKEHETTMIASYYKPETIPVYTSPFLNPEDEFNAIGLNVASKLRSMKPKQRIIAEKLISDILFSGQLETLNVSSQLVV